MASSSKATTMSPPQAQYQPKTVLRVKRRLEESPSRFLVMSYKRFRQEDEDNILTSYPSEENVNKVFQHAGTIDSSEVQDDVNLERTIKEALEVVELKKSTETDRRVKRKAVRVRLQEKVKKETQKQSSDSRFKIISQKRGLLKGQTAPSSDQSVSEFSDESNRLFNLLDLVAHEEENTLAPSKDPKKSRSDNRDKREPGSITVNGIPMIKNSHEITDQEQKLEKPKFVFDLYIANGGPADEQLEDQLVSVRHADADYEFDLDYFIDSDMDDVPQEDDEDSNDEGNWRNDYPESDPEDHGVAYGYDGEEEEFANHFASITLKSKGDELSSDEDENCIFSREYDGLDDGLGGIYNKYKSKLHNEELADEVVSLPSDSDVELD